MYGDTGPSLDTLPGQATLLLANLGMRPGRRTVQVECLKAPNVMKKFTTNILHQSASFKTFFLLVIIVAFLYEKGTP